MDPASLVGIRLEFIISSPDGPVFAAGVVIFVSVERQDCSCRGTAQASLKSVGDFAS